MNGDYRVKYDDDDDSDEIEANLRFLRLSVIEEEEKTFKEVDSEQEENAITELNDAAFLSESKISLRKNAENETKEELTFKKRCSVFIDKMPLKGFFLSLMISILNSIGTISSKKVEHLSGSDIAFIRYIIQFVSMIIIVRCKDFKMFGPKKHRPLLVFRAFVGTIGVISFFFALKFLDPSDCLTITHTSVIITAILARIFLKEKLTIAHVIAILLTATGVFLISRPKSIFEKPTFQNITLTQNCTSCQSMTKSSSQSSFLTAIGVAIALTCALSSGIAQVTLKKLSTLKVHFSIVLVTTATVGLPISMLISIILTLSGRAHKDFIKNLDILPMEILYATIGCSLGTISQVLLNLSLKFEDATKIAIYSTLNVFVTFIAQYLILNIKVDLFSIIGSCSIIVGTFLILSFKLIENKRKEKNDKKSSEKLKNDVFK